MSRLFVARIKSAHFFGTGFPIGTFIINITGSLFLGWFATMALRSGISPNTRLAIGVGFVGGYTTFSTFMFESNDLVQSNVKQFYAALNIVGSLVVWTPSRPRRNLARQQIT